MKINLYLINKFRNKTLHKTYNILKQIITGKKLIGTNN